MSAARTPHSDDALAPATDGRGDYYYWRLCATGFCFLIFGTCAVLLSMVVFPLLRLLPGSVAQHQRRARSIIQWAFRVFARLMLSTRAMTLRSSGLERLGRPGQLIVANHPTLIDAILLLGFMPNLTNCVIKSALATNLLTRGAVRAAGYVRNAPTDQMIEGAAAALARGETLVMFPEGTRSTPGEPTVFHRGAANIALRAATTLAPVFIHCTPPALTKNQPWYRIPPRRIHMSVHVGTEIDLVPHRQTPLPKGSRTLNRELQGLFEREVPIY